MPAVIHKPCKHGHTERDELGLCVPCRQRREREAKRRAALRLPKKTHCCNGHLLTPANTVTTLRHRMDGSAYELRRCRACLGSGQPRRPRHSDPQLRERRDDIERIEAIDRTLLRMTDRLDLATHAEMEELRRKRAELVREKDGLAKRWQLG